jgi:hypothetical protein
MNHQRVMPDRDQENLRRAAIEKRFVRPPPSLIQIARLVARIMIGNFAWGFGFKIEKEITFPSPSLPRVPAFRLPQFDRPKSPVKVRLSFAARLQFWHPITT